MESEKLRALVVDDHPGNRKVARITMERLGFAVDLAENGEEAVAAAAETVYNVILMDMAMPVMDGIQATQLIRRSETTRVPIIALTGHALPEVEEECLKAGIDLFQTKPLDLKVLKGNLATLIDAEKLA